MSYMNKLNTDFKTYRSQTTKIVQELKVAEQEHLNCTKLQSELYQKIHVLTRRYEKLKQKEDERNVAPPLQKENSFTTTTRF